jgi:hypothetical protein
MESVIILELITQGGVVSKPLPFVLKGSQFYARPTVRSHRMADSMPIQSST